MTVDYDLIVGHLGELGPYHLTNHLLLWIGAGISGALVLQFSIAGKKCCAITCVAILFHCRLGAQRIQMQDS